MLAALKCSPSCCSRRPGRRPAALRRRGRCAAERRALVRVVLGLDELARGACPILAEDRDVGVRWHVARARRNLARRALVEHVGVHIRIPTACFIVTCHVLAGVSFAWRPARNAPAGILASSPTRPANVRVGCPPAAANDAHVALAQRFHATRATPSKIALEPPRAASCPPCFWGLRRKSTLLPTSAIRKNGVHIVTNFQPRPLRRVRC